jgi:hypothetical protein
MATNHTKIIQSQLPMNSAHCDTSMTGLLRNPRLRTGWWKADLDLQGTKEKEAGIIA